MSLRLVLPMWQRCGSDEPLHGVPLSSVLGVLLGLWIRRTASVQPFHAHPQLGRVQRASMLPARWYGLRWLT
jgi:hypothetical protein